MSAFAAVHGTSVRNTCDRLDRLIPAVARAFAVGALFFFVAASPGAAFRLQQESASAARGDAKLMRVVHTAPAHAAVGSLSPDGRYVPYLSAFSSDGQQLRGRGLSVYDLSTREARTLASPTDSAQGPSDAWCVCAFSRDANSLAYTWWVLTSTGWYAELRLVDLSGKDVFRPRVLLRLEANTWIEPYDWTPDGKFIAVELQRRTEGKAEIALLATDGGTLRSLKTLPRHRMWGRVALSPDGLRLAYEYREAGTSDKDIGVISIVNGSEVTLERHGDDSLVGWVPGSEAILYTTDVRGTRDLMRVELRGENRDGVELVHPNFDPTVTLGLSSSGTLFFGLRPDPLLAIHIDSLKPAGDTLIASPAHRIYRRLSWQSQPVWSPDGTQLAFVSKGQRVTIGVYSLETRRERRVETPLVEHTPFLGASNQQVFLQWSPDSRTLAVPGVHIDGESGVYFIDALTGDASTVDGLVYFRGWTRDGSHIVFDKPSAAAADSLSVVEGNIQRSISRELFRGPPGGINRLVVAPDATRIYYRSPIQGTPQSVLRRDVTERSASVLFTAPTIGPLGISPAGKYVTFRSDRDLVLINTEGTGHHVLADQRIIDWTRDDRQYLAGFFTNADQGYWMNEVGSDRRQMIAFSTDSVAIRGLSLGPHGMVAYLGERRQTAPPTEIWAFDLQPQRR